MPVQFPPPSTPALEAARPIGAAYTPQVSLPQAPQQPLPPVDITVEVVGNLPLQLKVEDVTRRLTRRSAAGSVNRIYPPTILELITLVARNPARPVGKLWDSITALTMSYDAVKRTVTVEYCVEHCGLDPRTGTFDARRRMVSYTAPESVVTSRVDKKLRSLAKYAER